MFKTRILAPLAALAFALVAHAQPSITQSWRAAVVPSNYTYDGVAFPASGDPLNVNPGQSILFVFSASFTPPVGSVINAQTVRGIGATVSALTNSSNANGSWGPLTPGGDAGIISAAMANAGHIINATSAVTVNASGISGLGIISRGALTGSGTVPSAVSAAQATDALAILWTPSTYSNRTVSFNSAPAGAANDNFLWVLQSANTGLPFNVPVSGTSSFSVNIIPAPASAALLGLGGLIATRRRRD